MNISGGSGGPSGCATGTSSATGVVSGTCAGYSKPSWQALLNNPADGVRDLPDLALFAGDGSVWGHSYTWCDSDPSEGGCIAGGGGTSFASPIMAGIQALVNQYTGSRSGNPNPRYYDLAAQEYGAIGSASCNSSLGNGVGSKCIFYDVTEGDNDVPCTGSNNCYTPSGTYGVLSTSKAAYQPTYSTDTGWDFATGIGTVNAYNLVIAFGSTPTPTPSPSPTPTPSPSPTPTPSPSPTLTPIATPTPVTAALLVTPIGR